MVILITSINSPSFKDTSRRGGADFRDVGRAASLKLLHLPLNPLNGAPASSHRKVSIGVDAAFELPVGLSQAESIGITRVV